MFELIDYRIFQLYSRLTLQKFLWQEFLIKKKRLILVYQMGRVGSTALVNALSQLDNSVVYHLHTLSPAGVRRREQLPTRSKGKFQVNALANMLFTLITRYKYPVKIITPIREPISRSFSALFYWDMPFFEDKGLVTKHDLPERVFETFIKPDSYYPERKYQPAEAWAWMDLELNAILGFDIYTRPFPKEQGYDIINADNIDLLLFKSEIDDSVKTRLIAGFLDIETFQLQQANTGAEKTYGQAYQNFVKNMQFPDWFIETMLQTQYTRHFYTPAQIAQLRSKWKRTAK